ncbi:hypothetical protein [Mycolicibacterium peregrinum]|uniref:Uncharacterized protein n=1 Tax=Mycolicibacterium peregrinum TaxID=43304 RepID=A0A1A0VW74_MYCPR|nr:hypothetical protein [Mycolicibacterium peregrinum]OBB87555.1 hypothetical protein A5779_32680 [Mycolicibacterium peregrinum]
MPAQITTTVYLNTALLSTLGFNRHAPAQLHPVIHFHMPVPENTRPGRTAVMAALETIFEELNIDEPTTMWAQQYHLTGHRSLSVGDVVRIGNTAWACASSGWNPLTADQLAAAIAN